MVKLNEEYERIMREIMDKQEALQDSLNQDICEKKKTEEEIRQLERINTELEKNINNKKREINVSNSLIMDLSKDFANTYHPWGIGVIRRWV